MKTKIQSMAKFLLLILLLVLMLICLNSVFIGKSDNQHMSKIVHAPDGTYDVLLVGSSHMQHAIQPAQLFGEQGIASCNISTPVQSIPTSYHLLREMIARHDPEVVILDLYAISFQQKLHSPHRLHQAIDFFPLSKRKIEAVRDLVTENRNEFYFPFILYHNRWKELTRVDYLMYQHTNEAFQLLEGLEVFDIPFEPLPENQTAEIPEIPLNYLEKIVSLCRETDTQLLLTVIPYRADKQTLEGLSNDYHQQLYNTVTYLAQEWGVTYFNALYHLDELEFDFTTDMLEYSHVNTSGSVKVSKFYGAYLREHFDIPDRSQDPDYAHWYDDYNLYLQQLQ